MAMQNDVGNWSFRRMDKGEIVIEWLEFHICFIRIEFAEKSFVAKIDMNKNRTIGNWIREIL